MQGIWTTIAGLLCSSTERFRARCHSTNRFLHGIPRSCTAILAYTLQGKTKHGLPKSRPEFKNAHNQIRYLLCFSTTILNYSVWPCVRAFWFTQWNYAIWRSMLTFSLSLSIADRTQPTVPSPPATITRQVTCGSNKHHSRAPSGGISDKSITCNRTQQVRCECQCCQLVWLSLWSEVQTICIWSSWCHCHPIISCFITIQIGLTFLVLAYPDCPGPGH